MSILRRRLLGGAMFAPLYAPEDGAGGGAAGGAAGAGAGAGADGAAAGGGAVAAGAGGDGSAAGAGAAAAGAAAGGAAAAAATTVAGGDAGTTARTTATQQNWLQGAPADWRAQLAGEDKAFLTQLNRHASLKSAFDWLRQTSLKVAAGELKEPRQKPGEGATPEQLASWRAENGLPAEAKGYIDNLALGEGIVPGEADKPLLEEVAAMAHERGYPQEAVNDFVGLYYEMQQERQAQQGERDQQFHLSSEEALRTEMGADFKGNMNALKNFWSNAPTVQVEGYDEPVPMAALMLGARLPDGHLVGDIPQVASFVANLARELDPAAAMLPAGHSGQQTIEGRIAEIDALMYKDSSIPGRTGPHYTPAVQQEYRELIDAREKMKARGQAA